MTPKPKQPTAKARKPSARFYNDGNLPRNYSKTPTYESWRNMIRRCYNPSLRLYPLYGGRGITVCDRWKRSYFNFLTDMGDMPEGMSIDRIETNGNYEPSNCRWADDVTQRRNRRDVVLYDYCGEYLTITELAAKAGCSRGTIRKRLIAGLNADAVLRALGIPQKKGRK
jgi:hypothetical protein